MFIYSSILKTSCYYKLKYVLSKLIELNDLNLIWIIREISCI